MEFFELQLADANEAVAQQLREAGYDPVWVWIDKDDPHMENSLPGAVSALAMVGYHEKNGCLVRAAQVWLMKDESVWMERDTMGEIQEEFNREYYAEEDGEPPPSGSDDIDDLFDRSDWPPRRSE